MGGFGCWVYSRQHCWSCSGIMAPRHSSLELEVFPHSAYFSRTDRASGHWNQHHDASGFMSRHLRIFSSCWHDLWVSVQSGVSILVEANSTFLINAAICMSWPRIQEMSLIAFSTKIFLRDLETQNISDVFSKKQCAQNCVCSKILHLEHYPSCLCCWHHLGNWVCHGSAVAQFFPFSCLFFLQPLLSRACLTLRFCISDLALGQRWPRNFLFRALPSACTDLEHRTHRIVWVFAQAFTLHLIPRGPGSYLGEGILYVMPFFPHSGVHCPHVDHGG